MNTSIRTGTARTTVRWAAVALALLATTGAAVAGTTIQSSLAEVSIIDRSTGQALELFESQGSYYVAGKPGSAYAIRVVGTAPQRVLAVMSVDGVNVITGQTAHWDQMGYVVQPGQTSEITGWRKSDQSVAAFEFTTLPNSYAARTGRWSNIGVIGLALFAEQPVALSMSPGITAEQNSAGAARDTGAALESAQPRLGTGHGAIERSDATRTDFKRSTRTPIQIVAINYDSYDNLRRAGIIPEPSRVRPNPFPAAPSEYVPDPPRR